MWDRQIQNVKKGQLLIALLRDSLICFYYTTRLPSPNNALNALVFSESSILKLLHVCQGFGSRNPPNQTVLFWARKLQRGCSLIAPASPWMGVLCKEVSTTASGSRTSVEYLNTNLMFTKGNFSPHIHGFSPTQVMAISWWIVTDGCRIYLNPTYCRSLTVMHI